MASTVKLSDKCNLLLKPTSKNTVHFVNFPTKNFLGSAGCIAHKHVEGIKTHWKRLKNIHHQTNQPINQTISNLLFPSFKLLGETNK